MDFKSRLFEEQQQLNERLEKLILFQMSEQFSKIPTNQQTLLNIQVFAMQTYSQILLERIALLV